MKQKNRYMLISVCERDIMTEIFDSKEKAQTTMHEEMVKWGKVPEEIFQEEIEYDDGDCGFGEWSAYVNDGVNHDNYDWLIVAI